MRNWARAKARNADRRGRLAGRRAAGEDGGDDDVVCPSAAVITSSMNQKLDTTHNSIDQ